MHETVGHVDGRYVRGWCNDLGVTLCGNWCSITALAERSKREQSSAAVRGSVSAWRSATNVSGVGALGRSPLMRAAYSFVLRRPARPCAGGPIARANETPLYDPHHSARGPRPPRPRGFSGEGPGSGVCSNPAANPEFDNATPSAGRGTAPPAAPAGRGAGSTGRRRRAAGPRRPRRWRCRCRARAVRDRGGRCRCRG